MVIVTKEKQRGCLTTSNADERYPGVGTLLSEYLGTPPLPPPQNCVGAERLRLFSRTKRQRL
jgi:hypothetical protein